MKKEMKKNVIKSLIEKGEVFCAEVCAYDWHMHKYFEKVVKEKESVIACSSSVITA